MELLGKILFWLMAWWTFCAIITRPIAYTIALAIIVLIGHYVFGVRYFWE